MSEARLIQAVNALVGRPWELGGFDCWGFVRVVYAEALGIDLPALPGVDGGDHRASSAALVAARDSGDWTPVLSPRAGDAVVMGRRARPHHVGIWLPVEGGLVAHCDQTHGVICQTPRALTAAGWGGLQW